MKFRALSLQTDNQQNVYIHALPGLQQLDGTQSGWSGTFHFCIYDLLILSDAQQLKIHISINMVLPSEKGEPYQPGKIHRVLVNVPLSLDIHRTCNPGLGPLVSGDTENPQLQRERLSNLFCLKIPLKWIATLFYQPWKMGSDFREENKCAP